MTENPYKNELQKGIEGRDNYYRGFGIRLYTLNYFLFEHHCDLLPTKLKAVAEQPEYKDTYQFNDRNEYYDNDLIEFLSETLAGYQNDYLTNGVIYGCSQEEDYEAQAYLIPDLPIQAAPQTQLSVGQAIKALQASLTDFYGLPTNEQFQTEFHDFLNKYCGECEISERG